VIYRNKLVPFTAEELALQQSFADQAVIAIENARLFNETREALEQQKASADILSVISNSVADTQPVFDEILSSIAHLFGGEERFIFLVGEDGLLHIGAGHGTRVEQARALFPAPLEGTASEVAIRERRLVSSADIFNDPDIPAAARERSRRLGTNYSMAVAPMLWEDRAIGSILVARTSMVPFSEKECGLLQSFADQAVIAIQNSRMFNETREALERQTATADILKVIASSPDDVQPVFDAIAERSKRLVNALSTSVFRLVDGVMHLRAFTPTNPQADATLEAMFPAPLFNFSWGDAINKGDIYRVIDTDLEIQNLRELARLRGFRSMLLVPLLSGQTPIGLISVTRVESGPFVDHHVQLLQTFADQAVIAIQNVRMFDEVRARTSDLTEALQQQTATADVLKVISRSAFDLNMVTTAILQAAAQLCRAPLATLHLRDGDVCRLVTQFGLPEAFEQVSRDNPIPARYPLHSHRQVRAGEFAQFTDAWSDSDYLYKAVAKLGGYRAIIVIPMMREDELVGIFSLARPEPEPFTPGQIKLVQTFADQAAIAIENARLFNEVQARTRDLSEALTYQTGSSKILSVIASSPTDVGPVLKAIVESACELCNAKDAVVHLRDAANLRYHAHHGPIPVGMEIGPISRTWTAGRAFLDQMPVHVHDVLSAEGDQFPEGQRVSRHHGTRTILSVPLLREDESIGTIVLRRTEVDPFSDKQISLLQTFADQAVIAIGNVRLFDEVQAKTRDLSEALARQTATSEILRVISQSPTDVRPVFEAIVLTAVRLLRCDMSFVMLCEPPTFWVAAAATPEGLFDELTLIKQPIDPSANFPSRAIVEKQALYLPDWSLIDLPEHERHIHETIGVNSALYLPLMREGECIGLLTLAGKQANIFGESEIALAESFRDQALIAIENTRLFDEVQAKTRDLTEALQQQTATADVLKVISRSAFDLKSVLTTLTESAKSLCGASLGIICLRDGEVMRLQAESGCTQAFVDFMQANPIRPGRATITGRVFMDGKPVHVADVQHDPEYNFGQAPTIGAYRAVLAVPLMRDGAVEGVLLLGRPEPGPFSQRQIDLVQTFADQAVIAIENVRLFEEVRAKTSDLSESLQQQTATAEVLKVISRSAFDLDVVLNSLTRSAVELCNATYGAISLYRGGVLVFMAQTGCTPEFAELLWSHPAKLDRKSVTGRTGLLRTVVQVPDVMLDEDYDYHGGEIVGNYRSISGVPLLRNGELEGVFSLMRREPGNFTARQIELVQTFADQAVIAIENVRLFDQVQARTKELSLSLEDLRTAQDRLVQTEKLASLGQLTAGIAHEIKNPLNFVNNFSALSAELIDELNDALKPPVALDDKVREEIDELTQMLKGNLEKVVQHGKRADSIVKNMLLHSREGSGEHRPADINAIVEESLNLAYHGARAEKSGFNITLRRDLDPAAGMIDLYPQEMTRVFLNLISNGFYAAAKRKEAGDDGFEPTLSATTKSLGNKVEIRIRDNGTGIPPEVRERMFNPFFTTKPAGEGTGLGLSMSHDIVVKQHGGQIEVDTMPGAFTEFIITLPRAAAAQQQAGGTN